MTKVTLKIVVLCGMLLMMGAAFQPSTLELIPVQALEHESTVQDAAWSFDGRYLATTDFSGQIYLWDSTGWNLTAGLSCGTNSWSFGYGLAWNPTEITLAVGCDNESIMQVDDVNDELTVIRLNSYGEAIAWSPNGSQLAIGQRDETVAILDSNLQKTTVLGEPVLPPPPPPEGQIQQSETGPTFITGIHWSPSGRYLAATTLRMGGLDYLEIWDVETQQAIEGFIRTFDVIWDTEDDIFIRIGVDLETSDFILETWTASPLQMIDSVTLPDWIRGNFVDGSNRYMMQCIFEQPMTLFDRVTDEEIYPQVSGFPEQTLPCRPEAQVRVAWSPDSLLAVWDSLSGVVSIWKIDSPSG